MRLVFPNAQRLNRGHHDIRQLMQACKANDVSLFILDIFHRSYFTDIFELFYYFLE